MTGPRPIKAILLLCFFVFVSACAHSAPWLWNPAATKAAQGVIKRLEDQNRAVADRRGVGRFRLENANGTLSGRAAWLSVPPYKLRIELLSPFGQPVATISGDGDQVAVRWAADGKIHRGNVDGSLTAAIFGMKIPWRILVSSLAFRVWIEPHSKVYPKFDGERRFDNKVLVIPGGYFNFGQRLFFDQDEDFPKRTEYDIAKNDMLAVEFYGNAGQGESRVVFQGKEGASLTLWPEKLITNQGVKDNPFLLTLPGEPVKGP